MERANAEENERRQVHRKTRFTVPSLDISPKTKWWVFVLFFNFAHRINEVENLNASALCKALNNTRKGPNQSSILDNTRFSKFQRFQLKLLRPVF